MALAPADGTIHTVPSSGPAGRWGHLPSLTAARGVAVVFVYLAHLLALFPDERIHPRIPRWTNDLVEAPGGIAVLYFFVLSGFLLTWNWRPDRRLVEYFRIRIARIWPAHIAMWVVWVAASNVWGRSLGGITIPVANLLLVHAWVLDPGWQLSMNGPTWTLSNEVFMYALLPLFVVGTAVRTGRTAVAGALSLGVIGVGFVGLVPVENVLVWPPASILPLTIGIAAAHAMRTRPEREWCDRRMTGVALGLVGLAVVMVAVIGAAGGLVGPGIPAVTVFWLLGMVLGGLTVTRLVHRDRTGRPNRLVRSRAVLVLGEYSYPIYLTHIPALFAVLYATGGQARTSAGAAMACVAVTAITAAASLALHHLVERPGYRLLTRSRAGRAPTPPSPPGHQASSSAHRSG